MKAYNILDVKMFTNKLFAKEMFDEYFVKEISITTYNVFNIDCKIQKKFYDNEELVNLEEYSRWASTRPICFDLIKGKKPPVNFKIVLKANDNIKKKWIYDTGLSKEEHIIDDLFINIKYENKQVLVVSGIYLNEFTLNKQIEKEWDIFVETLLKINNIIFEIN